MSRQKTRISPLSKKPAKAKKAAKKVSKKAKKSTAKKVAKKSVPAKAAKKKAAAKKAAPGKKIKKAAKKTAKPAAKKSLAKKAVKKSVVKKPVAKKPARKPAVKKSPVKKVTAKKAPVKKLAVAPKPAPSPTPVKIIPPKLPPAPQTPPYEGASAELVNAIIAVLDDAKAENTVAVNLDGRSTIADAMVVTTGRVNRHVGAIADQLISKLKDRGTKNIRVEGLEAGDWCLVDTGDVIIHIFRPEVRVFYNLEKLWSIDAPKEHH